MTPIDNAVKKLFGYKKELSTDINSTEYMKECIKNAPDLVGKYYDYNADAAIKDFLFEHTDIAQYLKSFMENKNELKEQE